MITTTPWERYDDLAPAEVVDLSEESRAPSRDHDLSIRQYRSECMCVYPVVDRDLLEVLELRSDILIEESEHNDPLYIHLLTVLEDRAKYISRSLAPTDHEDVMFASFPELKRLGREEDIRIHDLPTVVAFLVIEIPTRSLESEIYPLCDTSEEYIATARYRIRLMDPERDHEEP
jgi:hypothetical protein